MGECGSGEAELLRERDREKKREREAVGCALPPTGQRGVAPGGGLHNPASHR